MSLAMNASLKGLEKIVCNAFPWKWLLKSNGQLHVNVTTEERQLAKERGKQNFSARRKKQSGFLCKDY